METNNLRFTAGLDGSISIEILDSLGVPQDLTGCDITFGLAQEYEDDALLILPMTIYDTSKCIVHLTPTDTEMISKGEYEFQLKIIDIGNNTHGTERVKLAIDRTIG